MISSLLYGLAHVLDVLFNLMTLVLIVSIAMSWFDADPRNQYVRLVRNASELMCRPLRQFTSQLGGPFDFAPMIVMLIIVFLQKSIPMYLMKLSHQLQ
jgi:YggT family protein